MKKLIFTSFLTLLILGCDDRLEDLNTDKRNPSEVDAQTLFTQGVRETFDMMVNLNVNENPFRLFAQHHAQTTYPDESRYNLNARNIPGTFWINAYRDALGDLNESRRISVQQLEENDELVTGISNQTLENRIAATDIMMGYVYHVLVDVFGNVPYSEALDPDRLNPAFDDARTIYNSVIQSLTNAATTIDPAEPGFDSFQDPVYQGDMGQWVKFANSLKLRMGMRLADVDPNASVQIVNEALAGGVFESNEDNASIPYYESVPNTNPIYEDLVLSGRADFVAANTLVDIMNEREDPRRPVYFRQNRGEGVYIGGVYGTNNSYSAFTQLGDILHTPDLPGTILNYAEVEFLKAEAAERGGYAVTGTAEEHYHQGIRASFDQWGLSQQAADAYITRPDVNYATAAGDWRQKIGIQMWLALYNQGFEAWTTWRRLDFEGFNPPEGMQLSDIPVRFTYPLEEAQLNGPALTQAIEDMGGNEVTTPIFWDVQ